MLLQLLLLLRWELLLLLLRFLFFGAVVAETDILKNILFVSFFGGNLWHATQIIIVFMSARC